eukprot:2079939-Alexandrium_andersonii.AAC.1
MASYDTRGGPCDKRDAEVVGMSRAQVGNNTSPRWLCAMTVALPLGSQLSLLLCRVSQGGPVAA